MKPLNAIKQRRAVKRYDPEHEMTNSEIDQLMALTKPSPTAHNQQLTQKLTQTPIKEI